MATATSSSRRTRKTVEDGPKFYRNLRPNQVRVGAWGRNGEEGGVILEPRGSGEDLIEVPPETYRQAKFSRSVGVLLEEITEAQYRELMEADTKSHAEAQTVSGMTYYDEDGNQHQASLDRADGDEAETSYVYKIDEEGVAQFPGADQVGKGRKPSDGLKRRGR